MTVTDLISVNAALAAAMAKLAMINDRIDIRPCKGVPMRVGDEGLEATPRRWTVVTSWASQCQLYTRPAVSQPLGNVVT